jgi:hypothetical protein
VADLLNSDRAPRPGRWVGPTRIALRFGLIAAAIFLGTTLYERANRPSLEREAGPVREIHADLYIYPPKSYVTSAQSAQKLIGKPLWVKEGYRWGYQPGDGTLGPLEKIVPTNVRRAERETWLFFKKDGQTRSVPIGADDRFFVDEIFLLKDPRELWSHWTEEDWGRIEAHVVEPGMSEYQVVFALGAGNVIESSQHSTVRVVDYKLGEEAGIAPVRVTYRDGVVERFDPLS